MSSKIRAIRSEADYDAALARIELMDAKLGAAEGEELDVLTDLVELYEERHQPMGYRRRSGPSSSAWSRPV